MPIGLGDPEEGSGEPSQVSPVPTAPQTPTMARLGWQLLHLPSSDDSSGRGGLWDPQVAKFVQAELGEHRFSMSCLPTSREPWAATPGALHPPPRVQGGLPTTEPEGHEHGGPGMAEGPASSPRASLPGQESQELGPRGTAPLQGRPPQAHGPQQGLVGISGGRGRRHGRTLPGGPHQTGPSAWTKLGGVLPAPLAGEAGGVGGGGRVSPLRSDLQKVDLQSRCQAARKRQRSCPGQGGSPRAWW